MPRVIVTEGAAEGLERCRRFLAAKAPEAARRAGQAIELQFLQRIYRCVGFILGSLSQLRVARIVEVF